MISHEKNLYLEGILSGETALQRLTQELENDARVLA